MVKKCIVFMTIVSLLFCPMEAKASADLVSQTSVSEYADSDFSYNDIDNLIDDRNTALMEQNYEYADQLTDTLHEHGIQTITLAELDALTGNTTPAAAQYSKATASITVVTPTLSFGKNGAIASSVTKKYNINAIPKNYNSTAKAVSAYINGGEYNKARIKKIVIKGIQGKTVKSISLLNPDYPGSIT